MAHKKFANLTYAGQQRRIQAEINNLQAAIASHSQRAVNEGKANPKTQLIKNVQDMLARL